MSIVVLILHLFHDSRLVLLSFLAFVAEYFDEYNLNKKIMHRVYFSEIEYQLIIAGCWHKSIETVGLIFACELSCKCTEKRLIANQTIFIQIKLW